jgi:hypothetical protein
MTIYLLLREEQSDHGFVDTEVIGAFRDRIAAGVRLDVETEAAREAGRLVEGDEAVGDGEWQLAFHVREQVLT